MRIDDVSRNTVTLALFLNENYSGLVSEIWLTAELTQTLKETAKNIDTDKVLVETKNLIEKDSDLPRKQVLTELVRSLEYQIKFFKDNKQCNLSEFYTNTFGFELMEVSNDEIDKVVTELKSLEKDYNLNRHSVLKNLSIKKDELVNQFNEYLEKTKRSLPAWYTQYSDFIIDTVDEAPWAGFNSHVAPFKSKITLNTSSGITVVDLMHMSLHEAFAGHHTELSYKDNMLVNEGKGEYGLVIVYSPMTFISEGIAEATFNILGFNKDITPEEEINFKHMELTFTLMNKTAFMFSERNKTPEELKAYLIKFDLGEQSIKNILDFVTDRVFGKYAPVYHSANQFITDLYNKTVNKEEFLSYVFKSPCTPTILMEKFSGV